MKTKFLRVLAFCLLFTFVTAAAAAEINNQYLGIWYLATCEYPDTYPGYEFQCQNRNERVEVLTDGEKYVIFEYNVSGLGGDIRLDIDPDKNAFMSVTMQDDFLVLATDYSVSKYSRTAPKSFRDPDHYSPLTSIDEVDGIWVIAEFGMNGHYLDAASMNMEGTATFDHGVLTMKWTRDGVEKEAVTVFDSELNDGRLYTVVNGSASYIVTLLPDGQLLLNMGLNAAQWVFAKPAQ